MAKRRLDEDLPDEQESEKIRRLSAKGMSVEDIATIWDLEPSKVVAVLETESSSATEQGLGRVVNRLLRDPPEFCCPLSQELMEDPVVAADGTTYERSWIEDYFTRTPNTSPVTRASIPSTVLNPNQGVKSSILTFKENTVKEIFSVAPRLAESQALQLIQRGEDFVRPCLPDASARKKLVGLLLLRLKLSTDRGDVAKEAMSLLLEEREDGRLLEIFSAMSELDILTVLPSFDEETLIRLHTAMLASDSGASQRGLVNKELAVRYAGHLTGERLKSLWRLFCTNLDDEWQPWMQAAACVLAAYMGRLDPDLSCLHSELLSEAGSFLDDQSRAIAFAQDFFKHDLGISTAESWPPKSAAWIFEEIAERRSCNTEERLQLLVKAHRIDETNASVRASLLKLLQELFVSGSNQPTDLEAHFLKLLLEEEQDIPPDLLHKLALQEDHLKQISPEHLLVLAKRLRVRPTDGARVAIVAAKSFASLGNDRSSEDAFLLAFFLDHLNREAAQAVARAVASSREEHAKMSQRCAGLETQIHWLQKHCEELDKQREREERERKELEAKASIVWDLSSYDFGNFLKGQEKKSETFQLLSSGITAYLSLYPMGDDDSSEGQAALYLNVNQPAVVKWSLQSGSGVAVIGGGNIVTGRGYADFMPISEANGIITLRILSVQATGSKLRFL